MIMISDCSLGPMRRIGAQGRVVSLAVELRATCWHLVRNCRGTSRKGNVASKRPPKKQQTPALEFTTETALQQAIAGLLARLPSVEGVQITQGAREMGKDILFISKGPLGESLMCACVVKNHAITGNVDSSRGARTVLFQAQQAFDTPFIDGSGHDSWIQRVYIVTPCTMSQESLASIRGRLAERSGNTVFICGSELFELFKKWWPDFMPEEASALSKHFRSTASILAQNPINDVAELYSLDIGTKPSEQIYVAQDFVRRFPEISLFRASDFFPSEERLYGEWSIADIKDAQSELAPLSRYLTSAFHWGYANAEAGPGKAIYARLAAFAGQLKSSFDEALRRTYTPTRPEIPNVGPDAKIVLSDRSTLVSSSKPLIAALELILEPLKKAFDVYSEFLKRKHKGSQLLSEPSFLEVCAIADFYQVCPGLFIYEYVIPKAITRSWERPLLIVGPAGYGKTSFCRWNTLNDAQEYQTGAADFLPVYVPLHSLNKIATKDLSYKLLTANARSALLSRTQDARLARVRLYLDGLDEVPDEGRRRKIIEILKTHSDPKDACQIITCRDYIFSPMFKWISRLSLRGFDEAGLRELVNQWLPPGSDDNRSFFEELDKSNSLKELARTPLLATLIVLVFRQTRQLPESEVKLYEMFTDLLCEGWNLAKRVLKTSKFGTHIKKKVLRTLARNNHEAGKREFNWADIRKAIKERFPLEKGEIAELGDEFVADGILVRNGRVFQFAHLSFQEFLTAKEYLGDPSQRGVRRAIQNLFRGQIWWLQVMRFYFGLSGNPYDIRNWMNQQATRAMKRTERQDDEEYIGYDAVSEIQEELETMLIDIYPEENRFSWQPVPPDLAK